jgi:glutamyl-tRNA reductase
MSGVDYKKTPLELRQQLAFTDESAMTAMQKICGVEGVSGCVILATCNRTEVYISAETEVCAEQLLIEVANADESVFDGLIYSYKDTDVIYRLFETACGLHSAMFREDQIITQISRASELCRTVSCGSGELDVLFRMAVTTGKRAVSVAENGSRESSTHLAVNMLEKKCGSLAGKKVLVIGNGKIGILAARLMSEKGADVTITLRTYRHGESIVPRGCKVVEYNDRAKILDGCDIVISATKSPHYTITADMTKNIKIPKFAVDLAVPCDIEKGALKGCECYDIDDFTSESTAVNPEIYEVIESGVQEYLGWCNYRENISAFEEIKCIIAKRIVQTTEIDEETVKTVSERTADLLFGSLRGVITPKAVEECLKKLKCRMR